MAAFCFGIPHPLTLALANPPKNIFLGSLLFPILTMCPTHHMRVLLNITRICSMSHLVTTSTLLSLCHHFTPDSLRKKPMWMGLSFFTWAYGSSMIRTCRVGLTRCRPYKIPSWFVAKFGCWTIWARVEQIY
jgi:hypothetical protein